MSHPIEIFVNEEASKLLDYFIAYKKLVSKVEYIKCISALNSEVHFSQNPIATKNDALPPIDDNQMTIGLPAEFENRP
jgi:hypothetical protein